ncbi:MAG: transporter substrate-binding domain-containing protein [Oscillospiraceae bacterium]|jgi:polar amino acid transport system substrate-binding protein|nr:transporter substrate-binding domain-containing protein [Oscillospiraceae bacterium]
MKRWIVLTLALACILALAACGKSAPPVEEPPATPDESAETPAIPDADAVTPELPDGDDDLAYILANKKIVIGITDYDPMNYYDEDGKLIGFDTEFAEALCAKLGVEPVFQVIDWDTKEIELKGKTIDVIWNGLTVKDDRRENMDFSVSYLVNEQVVVVRAADAASYTGKDSFSGKTVVAEGGSAGEDTVKADLTGASYTAVASQAGTLLELKAGTADAAVIDLTMARAMTGAGTDYADLTPLDISLTNEEYAIGFRLGSTAVARINELVAELAADGTLAELAAKYGVEDLLIK